MDGVLHIQAQNNYDRDRYLIVDCRNVKLNVGFIGGAADADDARLGELHDLLYGTTTTQLLTYAPPSPRPKAQGVHASAPLRRRSNNMRKFIPR